MTASARERLGPHDVPPAVPDALRDAKRAAATPGRHFRLDHHELGGQRVVLPVLLLGRRGVDDVDEARAAARPRPLRSAIEAVELRRVRVADQDGQGVVLEQRRPQRLPLLQAQGAGARGASVEGAFQGATRMVVPPRCTTYSRMSQSLQWWGAASSRRATVE